jgi:tetratricopeptide (TPR) repeat protein
VCQLAAAVLEQGRTAEALAVAERLTEQDVAWDPDGRVRWHAVRARAQARLGDLAFAERLAGAALDAADAVDTWENRAIALQAAAEVHERASRRDEARTHVARALELYTLKGDDVSAEQMRVWLTELAGPRAVPDAAGRS